jgi:Holliday junction resolvase
MFDLIAVKPDQIVFIQCKNHGKGCRKSEVEKLRRVSFSKKLKISVCLAYKEKRKTKNITILESQYIRRTK